MEPDTDACLDEWAIFLVVALLPFTQSVQHGAST
jgi:hypothetical protein